ncbi:MAG: LysR family transcriptional regulator [Paracoccaceae bacterium]
MHPRDFRLLFYFLQVAQAGSIRAGAETLSVSSPVVSQAIRELEDLLGVTLMRRTTRKLVLTEAGHQVLAEAGAMAKHAGAAMNVGVAGREVAGTLRISTPGELAEGWLLPLLTEYTERHPNVVLSVTANDEPEDPGKTGADLLIRATLQIAGSADAAGPHPTPIAHLALDLVVAPKLNPRKGRLAERLAQTGILLADDRDTPEIHARGADGRIAKCTAPVRARSNDRRALKAMAKRGLGAALLIRDTVVMDVLSGDLVRMAPDYDYGTVAIRLIPIDPQPGPPVLAFLRMMADLNRR